MGFLDRFTSKGAGTSTGRPENPVATNGDDIDSAIDRVAELADRATDGKHTDKIDEAAAKLKEAADRLDDEPSA